MRASTMQTRRACALPGPLDRRLNITAITLALIACCIACLLRPVAVRAEPAVVVPPEARTESTNAATLVKAEEVTIFPTGDLFKPLLADPKEPRFYLSYRTLKYQSDKIHTAMGGYGEFFGLHRSVDNNGGFSWQSSFGGGIHAQFDLDAPSFELVNADYTIGFPVTFRRGAESYRVALYHQSSHLGDEFLLSHTIKRIELSFEALELMGSYEWTAWRAYYGGDYIVHQGPTDLKPVILHAGVEYYGRERVLGPGKLVGGWDVKIDQEHGWCVNSSLRFGLHYDSSVPNGRSIRVLAEGYKGFTPYGQFYNVRASYAGLGVYLGFE